MKKLWRGEIVNCIIEKFVVREDFWSRERVEFEKMAQRDLIIRVEECLGRLVKEYSSRTVIYNG